MIVRHKFDPAGSLHIIEQHSSHTISLVPTMPQYMTEILLDNYDIGATSLKVIAFCGPTIPERIVTKALEHFGPVLYSQYGSAEISWATIVTPDELKANSTTAGRVSLGIHVQILDEDGNRVVSGGTGRVFIGNNMLCEGYIRPGAGRQVVDSMVCTGNLSRMENGLLYTPGREDDMTVSGGEDVLPRQAEDTLGQFEGIHEYVVVDILDKHSGQALAAWVVRDDSPEDRVLTNERIHTYVKQHLSRSAVSRETVFLDELPRDVASEVVPRRLPKPWENAIGGKAA